MYLAFSFANCIHRAPSVISSETFLITNARFRGRSLSLSPLIVALHFRFCFFHLSLSLFRSRRRQKSEKCFSQRRRKCVAPAQPADYIVKYTEKRNYTAVDLCIGCLVRTAFYGCLIKLRSNYRQIIKKLSRPLSAPRVVKARKKSRYDHTRVYIEALGIQRYIYTHNLIK